MQKEAIGQPACQGKENRMELLGGGVFAFVSPNHTFGTDALLLADFASPSPSCLAADLGSGCGIIPLLWCRENPPRKIWAVELQAEACALIRQSVAYNGLQDKLEVVQADLRQLPSTTIPRGRLDLVVSNPPYQEVDAGLPDKGEARRLARREESCTIEDVARTSAGLLRFGGRLCICHRPVRLPEIMEKLRAMSLEPKRLRLVQARADKAPFLFLLETRKGGRPGLQVLPTLLLKVADGQDSAELRRIYRLYAMREQ